MEKTEKYPQKAASPEAGPAEKAGTSNADPDHLRELCASLIALGTLLLTLPVASTQRTAGCAGCHVHRHQRHLRDRSGRAGYMDAVHDGSGRR